MHLHRYLQQVDRYFQKIIEIFQEFQKESQGIGDFHSLSQCLVEYQYSASPYFDPLLPKSIHQSRTQEVILGEIRNFSEKLSQSTHAWRIRWNQLRYGNHHYHFSELLPPSSIPSCSNPPSISSSSNPPSISSSSNPPSISSSSIPSIISPTSINNTLEKLIKTKPGSLSFLHLFQSSNELSLVREEVRLLAKQTPSMASKLFHALNQLRLHFLKFFNHWDQDLLLKQLLVHHLLERINHATKGIQIDEIGDISKNTTFYGLAWKLSPQISADWFQNWKEDAATLLSTFDQFKKK